MRFWASGDPAPLTWKTANVIHLAGIKHPVVCNNAGARWKGGQMVRPATAEEIERTPLCEACIRRLAWHQVTP